MSDVTWFADKKNKLRRVMQHAQHRAAGNREVVVTLTSYPPPHRNSLAFGKVNLWAVVPARPNRSLPGKE